MLVGKPNKHAIKLYLKCHHWSSVLEKKKKKICYFRSVSLCVQRNARFRLVNLFGYAFSFERIACHLHHVCSLSTVFLCCSSRQIRYDFSEATKRPFTFLLNNNIALAAMQGCSRQKNSVESASYNNTVNKSNETRIIRTRLPL